MSEAWTLTEVVGVKVSTLTETEMGTRNLYQSTYVEIRFHQHI